MPPGAVLARRQVWLRQELTDFLADDLFASAAEAAQMIGRDVVELKHNAIRNCLKTVRLLPLENQLIERRDLPHSLNRGLTGGAEELSLKHAVGKQFHTQLAHHAG